jgi:hypothetical protein
MIYRAAQSRIAAISGAPQPPPCLPHPHGMLSISIPRALAQALQIRKGEVLEWRLEDGRLVLLRLQHK